MRKTFSFGVKMLTTTGTAVVVYTVVCTLITGHTLLQRLHPYEMTACSGDHRLTLLNLDLGTQICGNAPQKHVNIVNVA